MIRTEPIDAPLGALASGWDPGAPLSDADLAALRQALADRLVVVLRGQRECGADELAALARRMGEPFPADGGADTSFCDMYTAYETLPDDLAEKLAGRTGRFTITSDNNTRLRQNHHDEDPAKAAARRLTANPDITYPGSGEVVEHPVEMPHSPGPRTLRQLSIKYP